MERAVQDRVMCVLTCKTATVLWNEKSQLQNNICYDSCCFKYVNIKRGEKGISMKMLILVISG